MKRGIILTAMVMVLSCPVEWAAKAGAHLSILSQEWQKVHAQQEIREKRWKAIEHEAERMLKDMDINERSWQTTPRGKRH